MKFDEVTALTPVFASRQISAHTGWRRRCSFRRMTTPANSGRYSPHADTGDFIMAVDSAESYSARFVSMRVSNDWTPASLN